MTQTVTRRLSIFPLTGAVLFPGMQLPLHIFEPRYRALVGDALIRDRQIAMIQPQRVADGAPLFKVGCVGKIGEVQAMDDGRYNLILEGTARMVVDATPHDLSQGEAIALSPNESHKLSNPSDDQLVFLVAGWAGEPKSHT
jgi:Lon protease-like protein